MSIAQQAVSKRTVTMFTTLIAVAAGIAAFFGLGQLEDPEFTVKTAVIVTSYPGASPEEVEQEVTDRVEIAVQELPQLKEIESYSREGVSVVKVFITASYTSAELPQIWDELRKKVRDIHGDLPTGAGTPVVADDFGDVYGFFMAVVGDGFSYAELERYVDDVKKELSLIEGVARVELWGAQTECVYIDVEQSRLSRLGLLQEDIQRTLNQQNNIVPSGGVDMFNERLRIETTGEFDSPEDIADLVIRGRSLAAAQESNTVVRVRDFGAVRRGYVEPSVAMMRYNGAPAIGIACSNASGVNIVDVGRGLDAQLEELRAELPVGIEFHKISWQSDLVAASISAFMISLMQAVAIVLIVLWIAMGLRSAVVVGLAGLAFVIVLSFLVMGIADVDLQRMSLGTLVIAMGMMVDNAIVVSDGILVRIQQGMDRAKAAIEGASLPSIPLMGATIIAVATFYPIAASEEAAGEYCATLFSVVAISLLLSWVLCVTITPVMCMAMLPGPKPGAEAVVPYSGRFYAAFRGLLRIAMRFRWFVLLAMLAMLVGAGWSFRYVDQMFFPASARAQMMVDYWAPEGARIQETSAGIAALESMVMDREEVDSVSTFIGQGPVRFYLPVEPESPYSSYGQLIVNVHDYRTVDALMEHIDAWARDHVPEANVVVRKYGLGPSETWAVEARIIGPGNADPDVLRAKAREATEIMSASPYASVVRTNWRQRTKMVQADYNEKDARWAGVTRADIGNATRRAYDGLPVGLYRENDKFLPILLRHIEPERQRLAGTFESLQVRPALSTQSVPLGVVANAVDVVWEDPLIWRFNRKRMIGIQAVPRGLATSLRDDVLDDLDAIELPPGYELMWDGEYRSSRDAKASLVPGVMPAFILIAVIIVGLFNAYRPPLIIACVIPFAGIGITVGLLATGQPFGFVALLGAMSLVGMMIKNAIVLLDQVNFEKAAGRNDYDAIVEAAVSRLRPVLLAAGTTVLGVIPLLGDVFWVAMAVVIMFGLSFGSILTMVLLPVLYSCFYRIKVP